MWELNEDMLFELSDAANDGDIDAILTLAHLYESGEDGVEIDPEKAFFWTLKGAEMGNEMAMFNLGLYHAKAFGVERSFAKAAEWMKKASEAGDPDADNMAKEYSEAAHYYEMALLGDHIAEGQYAASLMAVGRSLSSADNTQDFRECLEWAHKAEGRDHGEAYYVLGAAYEYGRGVEYDLQLAFNYYMLGCDMDHDICLNNCARMLMAGDGVEKDEKRAFEYFLKSAEIGYGVAMGNVGQCYQYGNGTEEDLDKAIEWYEKCLEVSYDQDIAYRLMRLKLWR